MMKSFFPRPTQQAQQWLSAVLSRGDVAVDATLGNGHDALFLAQQVGAEGMVYGFDVQQQALDQSTALMQQQQISPQNFSWFLASHVRLLEFVRAPVKAVMFNLGYLPGADHGCITRTEETLPALDAALELLSPGGLLTIVCYPGHVGGDEEAAAVREWAATQGERCEVMCSQKLATRQAAPFLLGMFRKGDRHVG